MFVSCPPQVSKRWGSRNVCPSHAPSRPWRRHWYWRHQSWRQTGRSLSHCEWSRAAVRLSERRRGTLDADNWTNLTGRRWPASRACTRLRRRVWLSDARRSLVVVPATVRCCLTWLRARSAQDENNYQWCQKDIRATTTYVDLTNFDHRPAFRTNSENRSWEYSTNVRIGRQLRFSERRFSCEKPVCGRN